MITIKVKGASVPALGFGTYQLINKVAYNMVQAAIGEGIRHIDTAQMYDNETWVGKAIQDAGVDREKIFLTTKVWWSKLPKEKFLPSVEESLRNLKTEYVDLLLIHWPNPEVQVEKYMEQLMKAQDKGYAKHIGVSNHPIQLLDRALATGANIITNQVEYHPFIDQTKLYHYLREKDITLTAYSPIAQGQVLGNEILKQIASKYKKNEIQITLRWLLQQDGVLAIPRTSKESHLPSNFNVFDFELSQEEMDQINKLRSNSGRLINPSFAPDWD